MCRQNLLEHFPTPAGPAETRIPSYCGCCERCSQQFSFIQFVPSCLVLAGRLPLRQSIVARSSQAHYNIFKSSILYLTARITATFRVNRFARTGIQPRLIVQNQSKKQVTHRPGAGPVVTQRLSDHQGGMGEVDIVITGQRTGSDWWNRKNPVGSYRALARTKRS
jgi:hypothetical protein